ncbi:MAG: aminotransferase class IV [candidate division WOR-3 bacterium]
MSGAERELIVYFQSAEFPKGGFLPKGQVRIAPDDRGFMLGDGVYEVVRCYEGRFFALSEHLARLRYSLNATGIELGEITPLSEIGFELLRCNHLERADAILYIQVTRGIWSRWERPPSGLVPTLYVEVAPFRSDKDAESGIAAITVPDIRWGRCDIKALGLLPNILARQLAEKKGAAEAIFVRDGFVTEGSHTTVFGVRAGTVITHPTDHKILAGITRAYVIQLCRKLGQPVVEEPIPVAELPLFNELFLACTTLEVVPVVLLDGSPVGTGRAGPVTERLQAEFRRHVRSVLE